MIYSFNIQWYEKLGEANNTKSDPPLLIAGQSVGLAFNLASAILLLFRVGGHESLHFSIWCIVTLSVAIILDLLCLAIFGASHPNSLNDGYTLSTAYYLTLASAIMSLLSVIAMAVDLIKTKRHPDMVHLLTPKQRSLAMMSFHFMAYLAIGGIMYKYLLKITYVVPMCGDLVIS